jgi:hypothetical protein
MSRILVALLLLAPLRGADPGEIRKAAADVTQSLDIQRRLPDDSSVAEPKPLSPARDGFGAQELPGQLSGAPADAWSLLQWTLIGLAVVGVVALSASWILEARAARGRPLGPPASPRPGGSPTPPADPDGLLALAEEYAAAGRYREAMHQVLLAATAMMSVPDSLTSWELLSSVGLAPPARHALRSLIARVERAWFGKQPAGSEDYHAARGSFRDFASVAREKV